MHPLSLTRLVALASLFSLASPALAGGNRETPIVLAVRKAKPAVVNISSEKTVIGRGAWSGDVGDLQRVNGMGSGVIVDEHGYIVTNAHVVHQVNMLRVRLADGAQFEGRIVAIDRPTDLALIKIDAGRPLPTIPMGTSSDLMVGETVVAIGNAYGYENTVTAGFISALGRTVRLNEEMTYYDLIQTNADINPGNSGGALVNIDGDLIGVNVAIRAGAQGISFAIPVDTMRRVAADMLSIRRINHTWHGLEYEDAIVSASNVQPLVVRKAEGPSQKSGLRAGDRVVRVNETPVTSPLEFERLLLGLKAGDTATLVVERGDREEKLALTIEDLPLTETERVWQTLGLRLSTVDPYQVQRYQPYRKGGMYVSTVRASSPASVAGVRTGDVLLGLGLGTKNWETLNYDNVLWILKQRDERVHDVLAAHVLRGGETLSLQLRVTAAAADATTH